jgi:chaperone BCS1
LFPEKELIERFVNDAHEYDLKRDENKIQIHIYKGYWNMTSNLLKRDIDTIYMDKKEKSMMIDDIQKFIKNKPIYVKLGIPYKRNYLLTGPPGTGKTSFIFALASMFNMKIYIINFTNDINDNDFINALSNIHIQNNNAILLLEDIDCLFTNRETKQSTMITFSGIINGLDGITRKEGLITFMTTNHLERLDEALKRPGRVDKVVHFKNMEYDEIEQMYTTFFHRTDEKSITQLKEFYEKIKHMNITPAVIQNYFFMILNDNSSKPDFDISSKDHVRSFKKIYESFQIKEPTDTSESKKNKSGLYM